MSGSAGVLQADGPIAQRLSRRGKDVQRQSIDLSRRANFIRQVNHLRARIVIERPHWELPRVCSFADACETAGGNGADPHRSVEVRENIAASIARGHRRKKRSAGLLRRGDGLPFETFQRHEAIVRDGRRAHAAQKLALAALKRRTWNDSLVSKTVSPMTCTVNV